MHKEIGIRSSRMGDGPLEKCPLRQWTCFNGLTQGVDVLNVLSFKKEIIYEWRLMEDGFMRIYIVHAWTGMLPLTPASTFTTHHSPITRFSAMMLAPTDGLPGPRLVKSPALILVIHGAFDPNFL